MPLKPLSLKPPPKNKPKPKGAVVCRNDDGNVVANAGGDGAERRVCRSCLEIVASSLFGRKE